MMPIDVSEALDFDTSEMIYILRSGPGSYVDGKYVKPELKRIKALASVQQPTPEEMQRLPTAQRSRDIKKFICNRAVDTVDEESQSVADIIEWKDKKYEIVGRADWSSYGHNTVMGARLK